MKASRIAWITLAVVGCGVLVWRESLGQGPAPAPAPGAQGPVAVLDVEEVLLNYQRANDLRSGLERRRVALEGEDRKRKEEIDRLEAGLAGLTPDSAEYIKQVNAMRRLAIDRDGYLKFEMSLLQAEHHRLLEALYQDVAKMAGIVAQELHYKVVLYTDHKMPKTNNSTELTAVLKDRKVLWADPSVDITEIVLKRLNDSQRSAPTTRP
jgi:Skp family chaperone for outer membrane proteins